jgi:hypothetical protein
MLSAVVYIVKSGVESVVESVAESVAESVVEYVVESVVEYVVESVVVVPGWFRVGFWLLSGCFLVAFGCFRLLLVASGCFS